VADGVLQPDVTVTDGEVTLASAVSDVQIGLSYTHIVEPLPPSALLEGGQARATRMIEALFRLEETQHLSVDVGRGLRDISLRNTGTALDSPPPLVSGDIRVSAYGWHRDGTEILWRIEQEAPLAFTLLSVATTMSINE
jgi:hypothetical protein